MADSPFSGAKVIYIAQQIAKESKQTDPPTGEQVPRPSSEEEGDLIQFYSGLTSMNSYHARCLRIKSDCTVNLGMNFVEEDANNKNKERLAAVNDMGQSFLEVVSRVSLDFETTGNGYLEIVRGRGGQIEELYHCPSTLITHRPRDYEFQFLYEHGGEPIDFYSYQPGKRPPGNENGELLHFANYANESRFYGLPDWRGAQPDILVDYYAVRYNQKFFINSGIPDLAIVLQGGRFDADTEQKVVDFFHANFRGFTNAHRVLYLPINDADIEIKFEKLAADQKDRDGSFDKLRSRCRDNIVSAHGVPPRLVGIVTAGQLGGGGEVHGQLKIFQEIAINPRQALFELKLNPVLKDMGLDKPEFSFQEMDTKIQEKDSELYPALVGPGILEVNEAREELGYPALEEPPEPAAQVPPEVAVVDALSKIYEEL